MKWNKAPLGEITQILSGTTPQSTIPEYWGGENVWITPTDLGKLNSIEINTSERFLTDEGVACCNIPIIPKGSIIISSRAPIGHLAIAGCDLFTNQGCKSFVCSKHLNSEFLYFTLKYRMADIQAIGSGATFTEVSKTKLEEFEIQFPGLDTQLHIVSQLKKQFKEIVKVSKSLNSQLDETEILTHSIINYRFEMKKPEKKYLGDVLEEAKKGIGESWSEYPVLGATKEGLAPAKEPPGKNPHRYKPVFPGTVFYNPMRILIGSIAFVDEDDEPGITSPDYVALRGKEGIVDSRWFYYWLRSPLGEQCINSLARGAVRERMLFSRLAEGEIELPDYNVQLKASKALAQIKTMKLTFENRLKEINLLPQKILSRAFEMN